MATPDTTAAHLADRIRQSSSDPAWARLLADVQASGEIPQSDLEAAWETLVEGLEGELARLRTLVDRYRHAIAVAQGALNSAGLGS